MNTTHESIEIELDAAVAYLRETFGGRCGVVVAPRFGVKTLNTEWEIGVYLEDPGTGIHISGFAYGPMRAAKACVEAWRGMMKGAAAAPQQPSLDRLQVAVDTARQIGAVRDRDFFANECVAERAHSDRLAEALRGLLQIPIGPSTPDDANVVLGINRPLYESARAALTAHAVRRPPQGQVRA